MEITHKIGFGGGCHWCTEAVFQSLRGVLKVEQGYIASTEMYSSFSEGVVVTFNPEIAPLKLLIEIHILTHKSDKKHSMRDKYRLAIYTFSDGQKNHSQDILKLIKANSNHNLITSVLEFSEFKSSREEILNYYYNNPEKPFCKTFINPKLKLLLESYSDYVDTDKLSHLIKNQPLEQII
ncbi:peptide-methionine (S)-S-oxide reductase [Psychroserpens sp. MEBiC05023]